MRPVFEVIGRRARAWRLPGIETVEDCLSETLADQPVGRGFRFPSFKPGNRARWSIAGRCAASKARAWSSTRAGTPERLLFARDAAGRAPADLPGRGRGLPRARISRSPIAHGGKLDASPGREPAGINPGRELRAAACRCCATCVGGRDAWRISTRCSTLSRPAFPLIVMPLAFEQGAIAARVERCGAGIVLPRRQITPDACRVRSAKLLDTPRYRDDAEALRTRSRRRAGSNARAELIERATRPRR